MVRRDGARAFGQRAARPTGTSAGDVTAAVFSVADTLSLIVFPWFLMGAFHSLQDLTLKAAYAAAAVAALAAGDDLARRFAARPGERQARRRLFALAALLAASGLALRLLPTGSSLDALVCVAGAFGAGLLLGSVRALPRRSFPFAPRLPAAASLAALDLAAFGAVLAMLLLTAAGPILVFGLIALLYASVAALGALDVAVDVAAADALDRPSTPPPPLPRPVERLLAWAYRVLMGETGVARAPTVSDAATLAFQVLFALAVYKIVVHMEFTALALGLLVACGALGEYLSRGIAAHLGSARNAALAVVAGGLWTIGMFAGLAGSAFPPLEFVFWAGAAAGAATIDRGRARLSAAAPARAGVAPVSPMLGAPRLVVMVFAGYLVWWLSTWISKPHSINLVLTMAGVMVGAALVWDVLPAAVGRHRVAGVAGPPGGPRVARTARHAPASNAGRAPGRARRDGRR